jgi:hypothetical protein
MIRKTVWVWDLILFGLFVLAVTVPTYLHGFMVSSGLPPAQYYVTLCFGIFVIVAGVFGRKWRAKWRRRSNLTE